MARAKTAKETTKPQPKKLKVLVDGQEGNIHDLKREATDANGHFLSWTLFLEDDGYNKTEFWTATGTDKKKYTVGEGKVKVVNTDEPGPQIAPTLPDAKNPQEFKGEIP